MDKRMNKKTGEELQQYLQFRRRGSRVRGDCVCADGEREKP